MTSSIDGRLLAERWTPPAVGVDASTLRKHYDQVAARFDADGWIVGRKTMEEFAQGSPRKVEFTGQIQRKTHIADRKGRKLAVGIDPRGKLHYGTDDTDGDHFVAILGEQVPDSYLEELRQDGVSYLFAGPEGHDLHQAMNVLGEAFGVRALLLEGGGVINGAFLKARLIDEISLLIYPGIDGLSGVPSIFEFVGNPGEDPVRGQSLRHLGTETLGGGTVWLRYRVEDSKGSSQS